MKSRAAFEHTVRKMERQSSKLYFWTFTYRDVHALKTAMGLWNEFLTMLKRKLGFRGVRVLELHEEHGVHFHVVTDHRYKIRQILEIGPRYGFGRTDVRRVADVDGNVAYLCKYLSKRRAPCLRRVRLWAAFGDIKRTRVVDIVSDSPMIRVLRRRMGLPSPEQVLQGDMTTPKDKKRRKHERSFLTAKLDAVDDYFETFDPTYKQRQAQWRDMRFRRVCEVSPAWIGHTPQFDEMEGGE